MAGKGVGAGIPGEGQVKKFIRILINMAGIDESQEKSEKFYKTHHEGMDQSKQDAEAASPKIEEFLKRWKYELMLVGGAIAGIYALVKYSSVAHTMTDLLGRSFGFLADVILISLLPVVIILAGWILAVAKAFQDLPQWLKNLISWSIGTVIALEAISLALKTVGISAALTAAILGALAGLAIGIAVVLTLRDMGAWKALEDWVGNATTKFRNWLDDLHISWHNFWMDAFIWLLEQWNNTLGRIPGLKIPIEEVEEAREKNIETAHWQDAWDLKAAEVYKDWQDRSNRWKDTWEPGAENEKPFGDLTAVEWAEAMRAANPGREDRWVYRPLTKEQVEAVPEGLGRKDQWLQLGYWLRNGEGESGTGTLSSGGMGTFPSSGVAGLDKSYLRYLESLYPQGGTEVGTTPAAAPQVEKVVKETVQDWTPSKETSAPASPIINLIEVPKSEVPLVPYAWTPPESLFKEQVAPQVLPEQPAAGAAQRASQGQEITVQINHADIHLDPSDTMNRSFLDQIAAYTNKSNSSSLKRVNTYG